MMHKPKHRRATILLELIVVTFLVGIVASAVYSALIFGGKINIRSNRYTKASQLAAKEIEYIRSLSYDTLESPYEGTFLGDTDLLNTLPQGTANLVVSFDNPPGNTIKKAVATVTWQERDQTRLVSYTTLITAFGLNYQ